MADSEDRAASREELEREVYAAVLAFEQILEAMPEDRASLEALADAYRQLGDESRARDCLLRLVRVVVRERDAVSAAELVTRLQALGDDDADALELLDSISALVQTPPEAPSEDAAAVGPGPQVSMTVDLSEEIALAWNLLNAGEVTQEEYSSLVEDLTEMSAGDSTATVSLMHVLEGRQFKGLERILARVAENSGAPFVALDSFAIPEEAATLLPVDFMVHRGVVPFEMVAKRAMVAVLNPYDKALRRDVEKLAGRSCHFYLTRAADFDRAVARITEVGVGKADEA